MDTPAPVDPPVRVDLPQDLTAPSAARTAARSTLGRWRLGAIIDPVLLTVSELVGNAVRHGSPPVKMWLRRSGQGVRIDVHDESGVAITRPTPGDDAESGRGLMLIDAVSDETGVEQIEGDGKVVWATISPDAT